MARRRSRTSSSATSGSCSAPLCPCSSRLLSNTTSSGAGGTSGPFSSDSRSRNSTHGFPAPFAPERAAQTGHTVGIAGRPISFVLDQLDEALGQYSDGLEVDAIADLAGGLEPGPPGTGPQLEVAGVEPPPPLGIAGYHLG